MRQGGARDHEIEMEKQKKLKLSADVFDQLSCPMEKEKQIVALLLTGMTAAVEIRCQLDGVVEHALAPELDSTSECNKALESLIQNDAQYLSSKLKRMQRTVLTWHQRAAGAFIFLHPSIYGTGAFSTRISKCASAIGCSWETARKWYSRASAMSESEFLPQWVPIVKLMTWRDAACHFAPDWSKQWNISPEDTVLKQLVPYEGCIKKSKVTFLSKYDTGTTTAGRASVATKNPNTFVTTTISTKNKGRTNGVPANITTRKLF